MNIPQAYDGSLLGLPGTKRVSLKEILYEMIQSPGGNIPPELKEKIINKQVRLVDKNIYSKVLIGQSKNVKFFQPQDDKKIGLRNIKSQALKKDEPFLVGAIQFLTAEAGGVTDDLIMTADYKAVDETTAHTAIISGEFTLRVDKKIILEDFSVHAFATENQSNTPRGLYTLENFLWIEPEKIIELELNLGSITGLTANTVAAVIFHGLGVSA